MKPSSDKTKRTIKQLFKEFWLPFTLAFAWTLYVLWGKDWSVHAVVVNFGQAFFFVSYMSSQYFRVRKQAGVESSFQNVEMRINAVTESLERQTQDLIGHLTGGEGTCRFQVDQISKEQTLWYLVNSDKYPLSSISIRIMDLERPYLNSDGSGTGEPGEKLFVKHLPVSKPLAVTTRKFSVGECQKFLIFFEAQNGNYFQQLLLRWVGEELVIATRVEQSGNTLFEFVDDRFPMEADGPSFW